MECNTTLSGTQCPIFLFLVMPCLRNGVAFMYTMPRCGVNVRMKLEHIVPISCHAMLYSYNPNSLGMALMYRCRPRSLYPFQVFPKAMPCYKPYTLKLPWSGVNVMMQVELVALILVVRPCRPWPVVTLFSFCRPWLVTTLLLLLLRGKHIHPIHFQIHYTLYTLYAKPLYSCTTY